MQPHVFNGHRVPNEPRILTEEELGLIAKLKAISRESTQNAIRRGEILKVLAFAWWEYEFFKVGCDRRTGDKLKVLVDHVRMKRDDWERPSGWSTTYEVLMLDEEVFEAMLDAGFINYHTTRQQVLDFDKRYRSRKAAQRIGNHRAIPSPIIHTVKFANEIKCGDCFELMPQLDKGSVYTMITSPPYLQQRKGYYDGVNEKDFVSWFCRFMDTLHPILKPNGSALIVIQSKIVNGQVLDHIMRARLAVRELGWFESDELMWLKPDAPPLGSMLRPRHVTEQILWFSKSRQPFIDLTACGRKSKRIGLEGSNQHGTIKGMSNVIEGIAKVTNVITATIGQIESGIDHPAMFPRDLVRQLMLTYSPAGSMILDPFAGSGTTCLVAQEEGYGFIGFEKEQQYVDLARRRLKFQIAC